MIKLTQDQMPLISKLFHEVNDTLVFSCLQGHMGSAWADSLINPVCAQIQVADFCYFAGDATGREALNLVKNIPPAGFSSDVIFVVPQSPAWGALIEKVYQQRCVEICRYAIKKEGDIFDRQRLKGFVDRIPAQYSVQKFNEAIYYEALSQSWSRDFCSHFDSAEDFIKRGRGYAVLLEGMLVSGASSYTVYDDGIEIEIATDENYRRQGLAAACGAALILDCLENGLYPSWDAANTASVALCEELGYHFDKEYSTYFISLITNNTNS